MQLLCGATRGCSEGIGFGYAWAAAFVWDRPKVDGTRPAPCISHALRWEHVFQHTPALLAPLLTCTGSCSSVLVEPQSQSCLQQLQSAIKTLADSWCQALAEVSQLLSGRLPQSAQQEGQWMQHVMQYSDAGRLHKVGGQGRDNRARRGTDTMGVSGDRLTEQVGRGKAGPAQQQLMHKVHQLENNTLTHLPSTGQRCSCPTTEMLKPFGWLLQATLHSSYTSSPAPRPLPPPDPFVHRYGRCRTVRGHSPLSACQSHATRGLTMAAAVP